jgi:steroid delta-isomerase-like uncharacterized protein
MSEINKALARRIIDEIFSRNNISSLEELISENVTVYDTDKELHGLDQLKKGIANLHGAFPDLHYTIEDMLADNDKIIIRCKGAGTHQGSFRGIPATGKKMNYTAIIIWRFDNGKMIDHWAVSDVYGMLQQLDVIEVKM